MTSAVPRVARAAPSVEQRVRHLLQLAGQVTDRMLDLAKSLHEEHREQLWIKARTPAGEPYPSEEAFWEEAIGIGRRTAYRLIRIGAMLSKLPMTDLDRVALAEVGLYKMDTVLPVLERVPTVEALREWRSEEHTSELQSLRHLVC